MRLSTVERGAATRENGRPIRRAAVAAFVAAIMIGLGGWPCRSLVAHDQDRRERQRYAGGHPTRRDGPHAAHRVLPDRHLAAVPPSGSERRLHRPVRFGWRSGTRSRARDLPRTPWVHVPAREERTRRRTRRGHRRPTRQARQPSVRRVQAAAIVVPSDSAGGALLREDPRKPFRPSAERGLVSLVVIPAEPKIGGVAVSTPDSLTRHPVTG